MAGIAMETKYKEDLGIEPIPVYENTDGQGSTIRVWKGKSLKGYPAWIADYDAVFYIETDGPYRFEIDDQLRFMEEVLGVVVMPIRRREKALRFINKAKEYMDGQGTLM